MDESRHTDSARAASDAEPALSVIIPVYRTREYLRACLDSVLAQDLRERETIEIFAIDDGSPDDCHTILEEYASRHPSLVVLRQDHAGPSAARNLGLSLARGRFVAFLDSDDLVPPDAYRLLVDLAERTGADVCTAIAESFEGERRWINDQMREVATSVGVAARLADLPLLARDASPCNKIFRRALITREALTFPPGIGIREDLHFVLRAYAAADRITCVPIVVYHYRARGARAPVSQTMELSPKVIADLVWVGLDLHARLAHSLSPEALSVHRAGMCANLAFRLLPLLRDADASGRDGLCAEARRYLALVPDEVFAGLTDPVGRLALLAIRAGRDELAVEVARDASGETLTARAGADGAFADAPLAAAVAAVLAARVQRLQIKRRTRGARLAKRTRTFLKDQRKRVVARVGKPAASLAREAKLAAARLAVRARPRPRGAPDLWLVGERRGASAEDTGYHFFRYCREHHPALPVYFVTKRDAKCVAEVEALGNVLHYGTRASYEALLRARGLVYSDCGEDYFHRWRRVAPYVRDDSVGCFLQHGVIGLNAMGDFYAKARMHARAERVDLFVASSEWEKEIIVTRLGFAPDEVLVSGLSRHDALQPGSRGERSILVVPTWRAWLRYDGSDHLARSEYFTAWQCLLADRRVLAALEANDLELSLCLHFAMAKHAHVFQAASPRVRVVDLATTALQDELRRASLLVTDYSSVSFDMAYQERAILYYQFDAEAFAASRGAPFLDPQADLPGPVVATHEAAVRALLVAIERGLAPEPEHLRRGRRFFAHRDGQNSRRIFEAVRERLGGHDV